MKFECTPCNYKTDYPSNYNRHVCSSKHHKKIKFIAEIKIDKNNDNCNNDTEEKKIIKCNFCGQTFTLPCNLTRHNKTCDLRMKADKSETIYKVKIEEVKDELITEKMDKEKLNLTITYLQKQVDDKDKQMNDKDKQIERLLNDKDYYKYLIDNAGTIVKTSVNALAFVMTYFTNAPPLEPPENVQELLPGYQQHMDNLVNKNDEKYDASVFARNIIYFYKEKKLVTHIGDNLIKIYKKLNPQDQSMWNTDSARNSCVLRELTDKEENKSQWITDKKGIRIIEQIIDPIINEIKVLMQNYLTEEPLYIKKYFTHSRSDENLRYFIHANDIITIVDNKTLSNDILRYITPHFYLTKDINKTVVKTLDEPVIQLEDVEEIVDIVNPDLDDNKVEDLTPEEIKKINKINEINKMNKLPKKRKIIPKLKRRD